jgi:hypothetical protein
MAKIVICFCFERKFPFSFSKLENKIIMKTKTTYIQTKRNKMKEIEKEIATPTTTNQHQKPTMKSNRSGKSIYEEMKSNEMIFFFEIDKCKRYLAIHLMK